MRIHCLIENTSTQPELESEHGLSLLIETGGIRILFDTGASPAFAHNAERMGIDLSTVDMAVISHGHYDHGGGIARFLELNSRAPVWVNQHTFAPHFNITGKDIGLPPGLAEHPRILPVCDAVTHLAPGISLHSSTVLPTTYPAENTGMTTLLENSRVPDDFRHEQYLLIDESGQKILFSGCSHCGILNIATHFQADILIGGFHFMKLPPDTAPRHLEFIANLLLSLPTRYYTGHCTGEMAYNILKSRMQDRIHPISTGSRLSL